MRHMHNLRWKVTGRMTLLFGIATGLGGALIVALPTVPSLAQAGATGKPQTPKNGDPRKEKFDMLVRDDFFAGFNGDKARLERAMKKCEQTLAQNPQHAEAKVWHGCGLSFQAAAFFQSGDTKKGMEVWQKGVGEMDAAVKAEPNNISVRIPRAAALLPAAANMLDANYARTLYERVASDYDKVYAVQKAGLDRLTEHSRGELLFGLAQAQIGLGNEEAARDYLQQVLTACKQMEYRQEAQKWLDKRPLVGSKVNRRCIGCHSE